MVLALRARLAPGILAATLVALAGVPQTALGCSICRCGDPTFNALGKAGFNAPGLRLALDWDRFDKDEGNPAEESESQVEKRFTGLVSYGFGERFVLNARVPYSVRDLKMSMPGEETEAVHTSGLSDPEIYGQLRLWASPLTGAVGRRASLSLVAGLKTPWGQNDVREAGLRVDEHAQPGTGSTDAFGGLALLYLIDRESALFASSGYRGTGENDFGYRYGSSFTANLAYEHKLGSRLDGVLELNFRHASRDRVDLDGTLDDNTGGALLYLTPRLLVYLGAASCCGPAPRFRRSRTSTATRRSGSWRTWASPTCSTADGRPRRDPYLRQCSVASTSRAERRAEISLDWLIRLRWGALAGLVATVAVAGLALDAPLPLPRLAGLGLALFVSNLWLGAARRTAAFPRALCGAALTLDTLILTGLLHATGGASNPFSVLYLVYITLAAVVLGARWTWFLAALSVGCYGLLFAMQVPLEHAIHLAPEMRLHLQGMWVAFCVAAVLTAHFVVQMSTAIERRDAEMAAMRDRAARSERLASLATLAAGAAHESGRLSPRSRSPRGSWSGRCARCLGRRRAPWSRTPPSSARRWIAAGRS